MRTTDNLVAALRALCEREGGYQTVAAVADVNAANLWQILHGTKLKSGKPRGVGRRLADKLDSSFPGWTHTQHTDAGAKPTGTPVAHLMSYHKAPHPPMLAWEELLKPFLPPVFRVSMTDDAMSPWLLPGDIVTIRRDTPPVRGQPVLARDRRGGLFVRLYRERTAGRWIAAPVNPAFDALDSERDDLTVIGVLIGMERPLP